MSSPISTSRNIPLLSDYSGGHHSPRPRSSSTELSSFAKENLFVHISIDVADDPSPTEQFIEPLTPLPPKIKTKKYVNCSETKFYAHVITTSGGGWGGAIIAVASSAPAWAVITAAGCGSFVGFAAVAGYYIRKEGLRDYFFSSSVNTPIDPSL